jgi:uncharacterized protein YheU (UPF0270 family)
MTTSDREQQGVAVPWDQLDAETLRRVAEAFVTREGTDYGEVEETLEKKASQVIAQLRRGEAELRFDLDDETFDIVPVRRGR